MLLATFAFERERFRDDGDRQRSKLARQRRDDGSGSAARAPAEAGGEKDHVRAFKRLDDLVGVFERGFAAHLGIGARPEPFGKFPADLQLDGGLRELQRLQIRVRGDELDSLDLGADHPVDGVASAAAHSDHLDPRAL